MPGHSHKCNLTTRLKNLRELVEKSTPSVQSSLTVGLITKKLSTENQDEVTFNNFHGKKSHVRIIFGKESIKRSKKLPLFPAETFLEIQTKYNLSQNVTRYIAKDIRDASSTLVITNQEPHQHLKEKLQNRIHIYDEFFTSKIFNFVKIVGNTTEDSSRVVVFCENLYGFLDSVKKQRSLSEFYLKFGIDGGGKFLKVCLSVFSKQNEEVIGNAEVQSVKSTKKFKDSSVKKLFILALAPNTQENYENVKLLWLSLQINCFPFIVSTDLKLANLLIGIMAHSSSFPCTWCEIGASQLDSRGILRTLGNLMQNHLNWVNAGAKKNDAKYFKCCIHGPILGSFDQEDKLILLLIPLPELHLLLGVVNTTYDHMLKEFETEAILWAESCYVHREITQGTGFKGNACNILLKKTDILEQICNDRGSEGCLKYVKVLNDFNEVVHSCFKKELKLDYKEKIAVFRKSYLDLKVNVTPKVHAVFFHIEDFCEITKTGLGEYSEQAMESVHYDFTVIWNKYAVPADHPEYSRQLRRAVCEYNGLHT